MQIIIIIWVNKIFNSIKKTRNLITIDTGFKEFGVGSEIVSQVTTNCFDYLKNPPIRMGLPSHPTPSSRGYINKFYVQQIDIFNAIKSLIKVTKLKSKKIIKEISKKKSENDKPNKKFTGPF